MADLFARLQTSILVFATALLATSVAFAQDGSSKGNDFSIYLGSHLPNQVDGVSEILPVFGGRYGLGTQLGAVEFGGSNTHAEGVDFTTFSVSLRGDVPAGDGLDALLYVGVDLNWYRPENQSDRKTETGFHIGTGAMMKVSDSLWLRTDLKFMGGPGTNLFLLFGFVFRNTL